jgi:hypothetical protein
MQKFLWGCLVVGLLGVTTVSANQLATPVVPTVTKSALTVQKLDPGAAQAVQPTTVVGTWQLANQRLKLRADGSYRLTMGEHRTDGYWQLSGQRTLTLTDAVGQQKHGLVTTHHLRFADQAEHWTKL